MADASTKSLIKSCLISSKRELTLADLARDFEDLVGSPIHFRERGFQSLELLLQSIPDTVRLTKSGGETLVKHVPDASVAGIASLVSRQKGKACVKGKSAGPKRFTGKATPSPAIHSRAEHHNTHTFYRTAATRTHSLSRPLPPTVGSLRLSLIPAMNDDATEPASVRRGSGSRAGCAGVAAAAQSRLLSASMRHLSISSSDLSGGGRPARAAPDLCRQHRPPAVCGTASCPCLHVCRLFVDGFCPRADAACPWGHQVASRRNRAALEAYRLDALAEPHLLWLARTVLHDTAPVTADEYRRELAVCAEYAADASCRQPSCFQLHVCRRMVEGGCPDGDTCRWSHRLVDGDNVMVLLRLRCAELSESEVLDLLARSIERDDETNSSDTVTPDTVESPRVADGQTVASDVGVGATCSQSGQNAASRPQELPQDGAVAGVAAKPNHPAQAAVSNGSTKPRPDLELAVCRHNSYPSKCTNYTKCQELHLCRYFVAGICPYGVVCAKDHKVSSPHNTRVLSRLQLASLSEADVLKALRAGFLVRHPITDVERRMLLQLCRPYHNTSCSRQPTCRRLHICEDYVFGTCEGRPKCRRSHQLNSPENAAVLRRIGLFSLKTSDILDILTRRTTAKQAWMSWAPVKGTVDGSVSAGKEPAPALVPAQMTAPVNYAHAVANKADSERPPLVARTPPSPEAAETTEDDSGASTPQLCDVHASGGHCQQPGCDRFHVCGYFLANLCRRQADKCPPGHSFQTEHNMGVLEVHGLLGGSPEHFQTLLDSITLGARITFRNGAQKALHMCIPHNSPGGCTAGAECGRFHVCHRFMGGTCKASSECKLGHSLAGLHNQQVRERLGLASEPRPHNWATDHDLLQLLSAKLGTVWATDHEISQPLEARPGTPPAVSSHPAPAECAAPDNDLTTALIKLVTKSERCAAATVESEQVKPASACSKPAVAPTKPVATPPESAAVEKSAVAPSSPAATPSRPAELPQLCPLHRWGADCGDDVCTCIHLCPHFLADACRRQPCNLGHSLDTQHNRRVLSLAGRRLSAARSESLLNELHGSSHIHDTYVYGKLRICIPHNHSDGCGTACCNKIHICQRFVAGSCDSHNCPLGHSLATNKNKKLLQALGLKDAEPDEVIEMLSAVHGTRSRTRSERAAME